MSLRSSLLDPGFVRELEALRRRLEIRARSGHAGERLAKKRGGSAEFEEHRPYAPGDDPRRIDWMAYARTGTPVTKVFRAEEDVVLRVMVDASASMGHGEPSKFEISKRLAAACGYMALASSERAQVLAANEGLSRMPAPSRGRAGLVPFLRELDALVASGRTDLARAIDDARKRSPRPGLFIIFSDFFDGGRVMESLGRAKASGHDLVLVQILSRDEIAPHFEGDFALEDVETGEVVEMTMDPSALEAYEARLEGLFHELRTSAKRLGAAYVRAITDEALEATIRRIVARGVS